MGFEVLKDVLIFVGAPMLRSLVGYLGHVLKDNKITKLELKLMGETVLRIGLIQVGLYFGLNGIGVNVDMLATAGAAFIIDKLLSALKKNKNVTNR